MKIGDKKYLVSLGVAFYPEKEMLRLNKQAEEGWHFVKMNSLGILVFQKRMPQNLTYSVDYFTGSKEDYAEYIALYEHSGWQHVTTFMKRYCYFVSNCPAAIFTDEKSYQTRIRQEWRQQFLQSLWVTLLGVLFYLAGNFFFGGSFDNWPIIYFAVTLVAIAFPVVLLMSMGTIKLLYQKRTKYYNKPEKFAKKQNIVRDTVVLMILGAILGGSLALLL
ncbi:DUF2812 domain-containing protein [Enterococcus montenegrensis]|uniref:DUF2812 domain-containing protein n=1 Tax=Enterococcus montenegrensis TaxID=3031993 RepID=UPI00249DFB3C|nr:DUF2812 domain-containing protein [Enterococcus montenegrensis]WHA10005.1 DUF2812 domain-containing protein [Enterococcus montenegrensis]